MHGHVLGICCIPLASSRPRAAILSTETSIHLGFTFFLPADELLEFKDAGLVFVERTEHHLDLDAIIT